MPYIDRDQDGHIVGIFEGQQYPGQEYVESAVMWVNPDTQKRDILSLARENREVLLGRLVALKSEYQDELKAATTAADGPAITLHTNNIAAIVTAINALWNAFDDPRVVSSVNGAAKQAVQLVYFEIVQAFKTAAPGPYARFKKLDAL